MTSIDPAVILWMLIAAIGLSFASMAVRTSSASLALAEQNDGNEGLLISARAVRRNAIGRAVIQVTYILIGIAAIYDALDSTRPFDLGRIIAYGLMLTATIQTTLTAVDWFERRAILRYVILVDTQKQIADKLATLTATTHKEAMAALQSIHDDVTANTALTEDAKQQAAASYNIANALNEKIATISQASASDSHDILTEIKDTGKDTNLVAREVKTIVTTGEVPAVARNSARRRLTAGIRSRLLRFRR